MVIKFNSCFSGSTFRPAMSLPVSRVFFPTTTVKLRGPLIDRVRPLQLRFHAAFGTVVVVVTPLKVVRATEALQTIHSGNQRLINRPDEARQRPTVGIFTRVKSGIDQRNNIRMQLVYPPPAHQVDTRFSRLPREVLRYRFRDIGSVSVLPPSIG